jgi:hypothetical protein
MLVSRIKCFGFRDEGLINCKGIALFTLYRLGAVAFFSFSSGLV